MGETLSELLRDRRKNVCFALTRILGHLSISLMIRVVFFVFTGLLLCVTPCKGDLSEALNPLYKPNLASARVAVKNLEELREKGKVDEVEISELSEAIANLYRAEFRNSKAVELGHKDEKDALDQDKAAIDWLQGNALSRGNPRLARAAKVKAMNLRKTAADRNKKAQEGLIAAMKAVDEKIKILFEAGNVESSYILHGCVETMNVIYLRDRPFKQSVTSKDLKKFKDYLVQRPQILSDARAAEKGGDYQKAFALFTEANEKEGRRRNASLLAKELETNKLFGEAAEKYELAGEFAESKRLREAHPELIKNSFTRLSSVELFKKVEPAIVKIVVVWKDGGGHGTGFFYKSGGYILTNRHVARPTDKKGKRLDVKNIVVSTSDGREFDAKVLAATPELSTSADLAVLKIDLKGHQVLRLGDGLEIDNGTDVAVVGFPKFIEAKKATINTGVVSMNAREYLGQTWIQTDATINGGNSGGPLLRSNGTVVGVVTLTVIGRDKDLDDINLAITMNAVRGFLKKYQSRIYAD